MNIFKKLFPNYLTIPDLVIYVGYGKLTKYLPDKEIFYLSIPEVMTIVTKLVRYMQNSAIIIKYNN
jgi:hypothetical protein